MKKNILKIIAINLICILLFGLILEIFAFIIHFLMYRDEFISTGAFRWYANMFNIKNFRLKEDIFPIITFNGNKNQSIIVLGGSFAWGSCLEEKDSLSSLLSDYTGMSVYNSALPGMGTSSALYRVKTLSNYDKIKDIHSVVYVFQEDHLRRNLMYSPNTLYNEFCVNYHLDNDKNLQLTKYNKIIYFINSLYIARLFRNSYAVSNRYSQYSQDLFIKIIDEMYNQTKAKYPNAQVIILFYYDGSQIYAVKNPEKVEPLMLSLLQKIKRQHPDIKILKTKDFDCGENIAEGKYHAEDKLHPSKEVWHLLVPDITKAIFSTNK